VPLLYEKENVSALYEVGSYWDSQVQIDVVGLRRDGWIDLGECKWGAVKSLVSAAAELEEKVRHYVEVERHIDRANSAPAIQAAMCRDDRTKEIGHDRNIET
jgi:Archaea bacterial proteins of unknown function